MNPSVLRDAAHAGMEVREVISLARHPGCGSAAGVEAEKIDTGLSAVCHIGADVEFRERGEAGQLREPAGTNAAHVEGRDCDPALLVEGMEFECGWDERAHDLRIDGPVREEKIVPGLLHDPGTRRYGPRTVSADLKHRVQVSTPNTAFCRLVQQLRELAVV